MPQSCYRIVVEVDVRDLDLGRQRIGIDRESVIMRCDLDLARREVLDGLIAAAMTEFKFISRPPERLAQKLVTQADAEDWLSGRR